MRMVLKSISEYTHLNNNVKQFFSSYIYANNIRIMFISGENDLYVHGAPEWATCGSQNRPFPRPSWSPKVIAVYLSMQDYIPASGRIADHVHPPQPPAGM